MAQVGQKKSKSISRKFILATAVAAAGIGWSSHTAPAAVIYTWTGATNNNWDTVSTDWSGGGSTWVNDVVNSQAVFATVAGGTGTITLDPSGISANSITFNSGATGYTFVSGTLTLGSGGITANETDRINSAIALSASQSWTTATGKTLNIGGNITSGAAGTQTLAAASTGNANITGNIGGGTGTIALTKSGAGTLTLSGANTYSGGTTISGGTIVLTGGNDRLLNTSTFNFTGTSTLDVGSTSQTLANLTVANGVTGTAKGSGGTLTLAGNAFQLGSATASSAQTLNMAGLSNFIYNSSGTAFAVGGAVTGVAAGATATMTFAATNSITASSFTVGFTGGTNASSVNNGTVNLGAINTIDTNIITVGSNRDSSTLQYATGTTNGTLTLRGVTGGVSRVATVNIGVASAPANGAKQGTVNLTGNVSGTSTLDAMIGTMTIGSNTRASSAGGNPVNVTGTFTMGTGTLDATTIIIGQNLAGFTSGGASTTAGTFTVGGGTVKVNTLYLADQQVSATPDPITATFNLNSGASLLAATIAPGTGTGTAATTRNFNWNDGTIQNYDVSTDLTISSLTLTVASTGTHTFNAMAGRTITEASSAALAGTGGTLVKAGLGTVNLSGSNTYTGGTTANAGTLLFSGANSLPTSGTLTVGSAGTVSLADGTARTSTIGGLNLAGGSTLVFDWNAGSVDELNTSATAAATGNVGIILNATNTPTGTGLTLIHAAGGLTGANYFLANNTAYSASLTLTATDLTIGAYSTGSALTTAYWYGGQVAGAPGAMALSNNVSNWSTTSGSLTATGLVPGATANAIFSATGATQEGSVTLGANMTLNSLTFNDTTPVTINNDGFTLTLLSTGTGSGSAISANASAAINAGINLGASQTWTTAVGKMLAVGGAISGGFGLTTAGTGTVTLSGVNTYTGGTTLSGGILAVGNNSALGTGTLTITGGNLDANAANVTLANNPQAWNSDFTFVGTNNLNLGTGAVALGASRTVTVTANNLIVGGPITGSTFGLTKSGSGTLTLNASNSYTGGTTLSAGILAVGNNNALGSGTLTIAGGSLDASAANVTLANNPQAWNGDFTFVGTNSLNLGTGAVALGASRTVTVTANNLIVGGPITGSTFGLTKNGNGTLTLNASNSYTGGTTLSAGILAVGNNNALGSGTLTIAGGSLDASAANVTLTNNPQAWNGDFTFVGTNSLNLGTVAVALGASRSVTVTANNLIVGGPITGNTFGLTKLGAGTLTLSGSNSYSGVTTISAGKLALTGGSNRLLSTGTLTFSGTSTLDVGSTSQTLANLAVANGVTGTVLGSGGTLTLTGTPFMLGSATASSRQVLDLSGLSNFVFNNAAGTFNVGGSALDNGSPGSSATMTLAASNTITASTLNVGIVQGGTGSPSGTRDAGTLILGLSNTIDASTINVGFNFNTALLQFTNGLSSPTLTIRGTTGGTSRANMIVGQSGSNPGSTATVDLVTGVSGTSTLDAMLGTLTLGVENRGSSGTAGPITAAFTMGAGTLDATAIVLGQITPSTNTTTNSTVSSTFTTGSGTVKVGTLTLVDSLSSANVSGTGYAITGTFNLNGGGTLQAQTIQPGSSLGTQTYTRVFNWNNGTIQNYDAGTDLTISGLTLTLANTGTHTFNAGTGRTITEASTAALAGSGGTLVKSGLGSLTLNGSSTYTGGTTVSAGTLIASNSTGSATGTGTVIIASGATLAGSISTLQGFIGGKVAVQGGGILSAYSTGMLTINGTGGLTLDADSSTTSPVLNFLLTGTPGGPLINVIGSSGFAVNVGAGNTGKTTVNVVAGSSLQPGTYDLINYSSGTPVFANFNSTITGTPTNTPFTYTLTNPSGQIDIVVAAAALTWTGTAGTAWNTSTGTTNWANPGLVATYYADPSAVSFNDTNAITTATLSTPQSVVVAAGGVAPVSVSFNNSVVNYAVSGGAITGPGTTLTKNGTGTVTLNSANTYGSGTTINAGTLQTGNTGALGAGDVVFGTGNNPTLALAATGGSQTYSNTIDASNGGAITISGALAATVGDLTIGGNDDQTNTTLSISSPSASPYSLTTGVLNLYAYSTVNIANSTGGSGQLIVNNGLSGALAGNLNGLNLIKTGSGTLTIAADAAPNSLFDGELLYINQGVVQANSTNALGYAGNALAVIISTGGTLSLGGSGSTINVAALADGSGSGSVLLNGKTLQLGNSFIGGNTFTGVIADGSTAGGGLTVDGTGGFSQVLAGQSTYTGPTTITNNGILRIAIANALPTTTDLSVNGSGSNFDLEGNIQTVHTLNGSGYVNNSGGATTFTVSNGGTFSGAIAGSNLALNVSGGTLILNGSSNSVAAVSVGGTLLVGDASNPSASLTSTGVTVNSGGILGGHGTITGPVTVSTGGQVQPGGSIGTLTIAGAYTQGSNTFLGYILDDPTSGDYSMIDVTGGLLTIGTGVEVDVSGTLDVGTYHLFTYGNDGLSGTTTGWTAVGIPGGDTYSFSTLTNHELDLIISPMVEVPEPTSLGLLGLGALALLGRKRISHAAGGLLGRSRKNRS